MGKWSYDERLGRLGLYPQDLRRMIGDISNIQDPDRVDVERRFPLVEESSTKGHRSKVKDHAIKKDVFGIFFLKMRWKQSRKSFKAMVPIFGTSKEMNVTVEDLPRRNQNAACQQNIGIFRLYFCAWGAG